ncbi:PRELI domain containing protein 3B [Trichoplax sp. H2]|nr:PRELI domain containing protein 3B [Trichoplax sp. H2]|eukprot:RDD43064.1 PRELI domain containing protein 3B [Trichoplax sp. H2]
MKLFTSEHTYKHPWEKITQAMWLKYPNPILPNVLAADVLKRQVTNDGKLISHRVLSTEWLASQWIMKLFGLTNRCYVTEHTEIDPRKKVMKVLSRNVTYNSLCQVEEIATYQQHPKDENLTLVTQEARIVVYGISGLFENLVAGTFPDNVAKGRQAMEHVVASIASTTADAELS